MSLIELDFPVDETVPETALVNTIERFTVWREATAKADRPCRDIPDLMMKTICGPDGQLRRRISLAEDSWASAFMSFWDSELRETA